MNYERNVPSIGQWMLYLFVVGIPIIGFILLIIWAFDSSNPARKNWAAATLIWIIIGIVILVFFWGAIFALIAGGMAGNMPSTI